MGLHWNMCLNDLHVIGIKSSSMAPFFEIMSLSLSCHERTVRTVGHGFFCVAALRLWNFSQLHLQQHNIEQFQEYFKNAMVS